MKLFFKLWILSVLVLIFSVPVANAQDIDQKDL